LRGTPGSACPQPEPNATELPSWAPISARAAQRRRRRRRWWRGEEGARRPGPEGQVLRHVLWCVLRRILHHALRLVLHVPPSTSSVKSSATSCATRAPSRPVVASIESNIAECSVVDSRSNVDGPYAWAHVSVCREPWRSARLRCSLCLPGNVFRVGMRLRLDEGPGPGGSSVCV